MEQSGWKPATPDPKSNDFLLCREVGGGQGVNQKVNYQTQIFSSLIFNFVIIKWSPNNQILSLPVSNERMFEIALGKSVGPQFNAMCIF